MFGNLEKEKCTFKTIFTFHVLSLLYRIIYVVTISVGDFFFLIMFS